MDLSPFFIFSMQAMQRNPILILPSQQRLPKGTEGFISGSFKAAFLATLNKNLSSLATYDDLSLVSHKAQLHLFWLHIVDVFTALANSW